MTSFLSEAGTVPGEGRLEKCPSFNFSLWLFFFLRELSVGRGSTAPVAGGAFPKIHSVEPWDGKDGEVRSAPSLEVADDLLGSEVTGLIN